MMKSPGSTWSSLLPAAALVLLASACTELTPLTCRSFYGWASDGTLWHWDGQDATALSALPDPYAPAIFDGRRLVYAWSHKITIVDLGDGGTQEIDTADEVVGLAWAGDALVVEAVQSAEPTAIYRLDVLTPSTGEQRNLVPEGTPIGRLRVSPDGKTVGYVRDAKLWQVPSAGGEATALAPDLGVDEFIGWSASGKYVGLLVGKQLRVIEVATGSPTYTSLPTMGGAWAPVGDRLVVQSLVHYGAHAEYKTAMWVVGADGAGELEIDPERDGRTNPTRDPSWSLDGTEVVWHGVSEHAGEDRGPNPLLATSVTTGETVVVHHDWPQPAFRLTTCAP